MEKPPNDKPPGNEARKAGAPKEEARKEEAWYDGALSEEEKLYESSVNRIKSAVKQGISFEQATSLIEVTDAAVKAAIVDDALKVLIAEMHFSGEKPLKDLARALKLPLKRLEKAKAEMLLDVEAAAIEKYKASLGQTGTA